MTGRSQARKDRGTRRAAALAASVLIAGALAAPGHADVLTVDVDGGGQFTSILPAMINADYGDTILVAPGTYTGLGNYDLDFQGKKLVIISSHGPEETIIDTGGESGFVLTDELNELIVIQGFTITNAGEGPYATGPIYISGGAASIRDCIFTGNHDEVVLQPGLPMAMRDCRFIRNFDRALYARPDWLFGVAIVSCLFEENRCDYAYGVGGGALRLSSDSSSGTVTVDSCAFTDNWSLRAGGAVSADGRNIVIRDCTFTGNRSDGDGGAMVVGGPYSAAVGGTEIMRCTFSGNSAGGHGGAISRTRMNPTVSECTFERNYAPRGGAICCYLDDPEASSVPTILDCTFTENSATMGAGVMCEESAPEIDSCLFDSNRAWLWGGGVCADGAYDQPPSITHCTFTRNRAYRGAALLANGEAQLTTEYCTFYGCGGDDGSIVSLVDGFVDVGNSVISFAPSGVPIHLQFGTANVEHCVVFANAGGDSLPSGNPDNLFTDPLLCDVYNDDFTLCENSPCLAANNAWGEQVGAHGVGCGSCGSAVRAASWGRIKAMYR